MSASDPLRLAILISGRGSNMAAIARACAAKQINAIVNVVISDRKDAAGLEVAASFGISAKVVLWKYLADRPHIADRVMQNAGKAMLDRERAEQALVEVLEANHVDLIVLAGFMRILTPQFVARYAGRILNIHPSLLPKYTGLHTHRRVLAAGDIEHGATVHFVTAELDGGPTVLQSKVPVEPGDTEATLSARVQSSEHIIYPRVIEWLAERRLEWRGGQVWFEGQPLTQPRVEEFRENR